MAGVTVGSVPTVGAGLLVVWRTHIQHYRYRWFPLLSEPTQELKIETWQIYPLRKSALVGSPARMAKILVQKQEVIADALDNANDVPPPPMPVKETASTESTTRAKIAQEAVKLSPTQIAAIHEALKMLAGMCDHARNLDGMGFNRLDTMIGHSLAASATLIPKQAALGAKLVRKYRRQLPENVLSVAIG